MTLQMTSRWATPNRGWSQPARPMSARTLLVGACLWIATIGNAPALQMIR